MNYERSPFEYYQLNDTANNTVIRCLNRHETEILSLLKKNKNMTLEEVSNSIHLSISHVKKMVKSLKEKGHLTRIGSDKRGYWCVRYPRRDDIVNETVNDTANSTENDIVFGNLEGRELEILSLLEKNKNMTLEEVSNSIHLSISQVKRIVKSLKEKGHLVRRGADKRGYWQVFW